MRRVILLRLLKFRLRLRYISTAFYKKKHRFRKMQGKRRFTSRRLKKRGGAFLSLSFRSKKRSVSKRNLRPRFRLLRRYRRLFKKIRFIGFRVKKLVRCYSSLKNILLLRSSRQRFIRKGGFLSWETYLDSFNNYNSLSMFNKN